MFQNLTYKNLSLTFRALFNKKASLDTLSVQTVDSFKLVALYGAAFNILAYLRYASRSGESFLFKAAFQNWVDFMILFAFFSSALYVTSRINGGREDAPRVFFGLAILYILLGTVVDWVSAFFLSPRFFPDLDLHTLLNLQFFMLPIALFFAATPFMVRQTNLPEKKAQLIVGAVCVALWVIQPLVFNLTLAVF